MFFDWDGDGDDDLFDDVMDFMVIEETMREIEEEERRSSYNNNNNNSNNSDTGSCGGCCLLSLALIVLPFAGAVIGVVEGVSKLVS